MFDLGPTQTLVLRALRERPRSVHAIAHATHGTRTTGLLYELRELQLVRPVPCSTGCGCWSLTDDGRQALEEMS